VERGLAIEVQPIISKNQSLFRSFLSRDISNFGDHIMLYALITMVLATQNVKIPLAKNEINTGERRNYIKSLAYLPL
jgi:hypothetical protein